MENIFVEIVQNGLPYLIAFSVFMFSPSPQAFPIDISLSSLNILWTRPDTFWSLSARALFFVLWLKFVFFPTPVLAYWSPWKGLF